MFVCWFLGFFFSPPGLEKEFLEAAWFPSIFPAPEPLFLPVLTYLTQSVLAVQFIAISGRCLIVTCFSLGYSSSSGVQVSISVQGLQLAHFSCLTVLYS